MQTTLRTALTPAQCADRLKQAIGRSYYAGVVHPDDVDGKVDENGFRLYAIGARLYRRPFYVLRYTGMQLDGRWQADGTGTRIDCRWGWPPQKRVALAFSPLATLLLLYYAYRALTFGCAVDQQPCEMLAIGAGFAVLIGIVTAIVLGPLRPWRRRVFEQLTEFVQRACEAEVVSTARDDQAPNRPS